MLIDHGRDKVQDKKSVLALVICVLTICLQKDSKGIAFVTMYMYSAGSMSFSVQIKQYMSTTNICLALKLTHCRI